jgi:hypothetical protein
MLADFLSNFIQHPIQKVSLRKNSYSSETILEQ